MQAQDSRGVDTALTSCASRVGDFKQSAAALLVKLEHEQHNWPSLLDNFTALSGHASTLLKQLRNEKTPPLQNLVILPLEIRNEPDKHLERITEGRVPVFHHEIIPDYLRTKLDLNLEQHNQSWAERSAAAIPASEAATRVQEHNSACDQLLNAVMNAKDDWVEASATLSASTRQDEAETAKLVSAMAPVPVPPTSIASRGKGAARGQSSVKADLKATASAAGHPYKR